MPKKTPSQLVDLAVEAAEEVKALDLKLLDVRKLTPMTDHMLVCTGTSNRHVRAIAENVALRAKQAGHGHPRTQGAAGSEWVLVDLGGIIVHVMQLQARAFYQLEKLWGLDESTEADVTEAPKTAKEKVIKKITKKKNKSAPPSRKRAPARRGLSLKKQKPNKKKR